jgi:hypothetical protein
MKAIKEITTTVCGKVGTTWGRYDMPTSITVSNAKPINTSK